MRMTRRAVLLALPLLLVSAVALAGSKAKRPPKPKAKAAKYLLHIAAVEHTDGVKNDVLDLQARDVLAGLMGERPDDFVLSVDGAPDPKVDPKAYQTFLDKKGVKAFDVRIKFLKYQRTLVPVPNSTDQMLGVKVEMELLGSRPDGTLAFTGRGSAEVTVQVGKKVPPKMDAGVHGDALKAALGHALDEAVRELRAPPPAKPAKK
jgi:hypothetical protein